MVRTPSPAIVYTYFFLSLAVAWIFDRILRWYKSEVLAGSRLPWRIGLLTTVIFVGVIIDYLSINHESTPVICPPAYSLLANTDRSAGVLNLPMTYLAG